MLRNILYKENEFNSEDLIEIYTDREKVCINGKKEGNIFAAEDENHSVMSVITAENDGIFIRKDEYTNKSESDTYIESISSRFLFNGGEYQVYTQTSVWQNESVGMWQPLNTGVISYCENVRTSESCTPFVALWNEQTNRGVAFHIFPESMWKIEVKKIPIGDDKSIVEVRVAIDDKNLNIKLGKNEKIELPKILYYTFKNKVDMDCYKLHRYLNKNYKRKHMPVIYNSWLSDFDNISYDGLVKQAKLAARLGVEYFVVDAGWFGNHEKSWFDAIGDWREESTGKLGGRLKDVSDAVYELGMKFGIWFEPERAVSGAKCIEGHENYYIKNGKDYFLDFSNSDAVDYLLESMSETIARCNVKFVKFDANSNLRVDRNKNAFIDYNKGYERFIKEIRARFPDIHIEGCAAGGLKMNLTYLDLVDSFWFTDNQSLFEGLEIYKNTILRMMPQAIDKIATIKSIKDVICTYEGDADLLVASNNGTWDDFKPVTKSYLLGFLTGTPIELSCDLSSVSEGVFNELKAHIEKFKKERSFWESAECRILADTDTMLILQYNDKNFENVKVLVYALRTLQDRVGVYPVLDDSCAYKRLDNDERVCADCGIDLSIDKKFTSYTIELVKE